MPLSLIQNVKYGDSYLTALPDKTVIGDTLVGSGSVWQKWGVSLEYDSGFLKSATIWNGQTENYLGWSSSKTELTMDSKNPIYWKVFKSGNRYTFQIPDTIGVELFETLSCEDDHHKITLKLQSGNVDESQQWVVVED